MKININEDFNEAFPDEAFAGFTLKQCLVGGGAFALAVAAALLLWRFAGIGIVECTYIAVPAMFPVCALGLGRYQGQGIPQIIKEWDYCRKTRRLLYEAGEKP
ncbi:MAG: PrgI family mobile element protein, partial [Evtepia sp.]